MSSETFDRLRLPIALGVGLMLLAGYLFLQRADADSASLGPSPSVVVGEPGGGVVTPAPTPTPSATASPVPAATLTATPAETPAPTPIPPEEEFTARVLACESISGAECNDEIRRLRDRDDTFVALVLFDNARRGDVMNVIFDGPTGPIEGGAVRASGQRTRLLLLHHPGIGHSRRPVHAHGAPQRRARRADRAPQGRRAARARLAAPRIRGRDRPVSWCSTSVAAARRRGH